MGYPTVRKRLDQIEKYDLPHIEQPGNTIDRDKSEALKPYLDGKIPEYITLSYPDNFSQYGNILTLYPNIGDILSKACDGEIQPGDFKEFVALSGGTGRTEARNMDVHAFYDPTGDTTHYFVLPERRKKNKPQD